MTLIVPRADWSAHRPVHKIEKMGRIDGVAVHHSGSRGDEHDDHAQCQRAVRAIQQFHQFTRGWSDVAYHFLACRHDRLFIGRGLGQVSAAQGTEDGNAHWVGVCVLGDGGPGFRARSQGALRAVLLARQLVVHATPSATGVRPHSDFHRTECPGEEVRDWIGVRDWS